MSGHHTDNDKYVEDLEVKCHGYFCRQAFYTLARDIFAGLEQRQQLVMCFNF